MEPIIIPTAYLPSITYFLILRTEGGLIIDIHENYLKQTCRNRAYIYSANGAIPLIVPVIKACGNHTPVHSIEIANAQRWQINHWRAIESAYQSSPFFLYYKDGLSAFYHRPYTMLKDLNQDLLNYLLTAAGVESSFHYSGTYMIAGQVGYDLRDHLFLKYRRNDLSPYHQVFGHKYGFIPDLSILDLLFNLGPDTKTYLQQHAHIFWNSSP